MRRPSIASLYTGLALCLVFSIGAALCLGAINLPPTEVISALAGHAEEQANLIVQQLRLPRVLLAIFTGAVLAISGAAMQGLFRNPLADPSLIGVTAGSSLGASLIIVIGSGWGLSQGLGSLGMVAIGAFVGGIAAATLVYRLACSSSGTSVATMLLAGIAITAFTGALGSLLEFYADNDMLRRISLWRMGGLDGANGNRVVLGAFIAALMLLVLPRYASALNAMLLGESEARHLGLNVERIKMRLVMWVALAVGTSVALVGTIAFVGLVVPHIIRLITGPNHRHLLPASALGGAALLAIADTVSRLVVAPMELPVGIITALVGVPFFISLLRRYQPGPAR